MKTIKEMIQYFEGVRSQHEALRDSGMNNPDAETIIKIYTFVISKLKEWGDDEE